MQIDAMYVRTSNRARGINKDSAKDSALQVPPPPPPPPLPAPSVFCPALPVMTASIC